MIGIMRNAINQISISEGYNGFGNNEKRVTTKNNMVAIDGKYCISSQEFIMRLITNKRVEYSLIKKRSDIFSNEFLTEQLNKNSDLFTIEV